MEIPDKHVLPRVFIISLKRDEKNFNILESKVSFSILVVKINTMNIENKFTWKCVTNKIFRTN